MWFEGSVTEAIYLARVTPLPVVIYVRDNFTASRKFDAYLNHPEIINLIADNSVALKIESSSDEARQFFSISSKAIPCFCVYFDGVQRLKLTESTISLEKFQSNLKAALDISVPFVPIGKPVKSKSVKKPLPDTKSTQSNDVSAQDNRSSTSSKPAAKPQANKTSTKQPVSTEKFIEHKECKLAIKLPDGKIVRKDFKAQDNLDQVRMYIVQDCLSGTGAFNLVQSFPRRVFTAGEERMSLIELGLCPNNTVIVQMVENVTHRESQDGMFASPFSYIQSGVDAATGAFNSLFGSWYSPVSTNDSGASTSNTSNTNHGSNRSGNIHTLHSDSSKDPTVTYNGNSTNQQ